MDFQSEANQYTVSVRTSDIHEALLSHEPHEIDEECEFEEFARDLLRVLTSHSDTLASSEDAPDTDMALS